MSRDCETNRRKEVRREAQRRGREQLSTLIRSGKHRARQLIRARILLKADASEAGESWSEQPSRRRAGDHRQRALDLDQLVEKIRRGGVPDQPGQLLTSDGEQGRLQWVLDFSL
jgi:hypothetical protein